MVDNDYGVAEITIIFDHYKDVIEVTSKDALLEEWRRLRKAMFRSYKNLDIVHTFIRRFTKDWTDEKTGQPMAKYCYVLRLLEICNIIVMANAETERGFAHLNDIWTLRRARLVVRTINDIM
eukprot:gene19092-22827_t